MWYNTRRIIMADFLTENFDADFNKELEAVEESIFMIEQDEEFDIVTRESTYWGPSPNYYETLLEIDDMYETIFEKSHGKLKYTYRVGIDLKTGRRVAIKFKLLQDALTSTDSIGSDLNLDIDKKSTKNFGHMNHITESLIVKNIFYQDGEKLGTVRMVGIYNKSFHKWLTGMIRKYPTEFGKITIIRNRITGWDSIANSPAFPKLFKSFVATIPITDIEEYHVSRKVSDNEKQGDGKYKCTKLVWDTTRLTPIQFDRVVTAFIPVDE
jgi:hypothetical protein